MFQTADWTNRRGFSSTHMLPWGQSKSSLKPNSVELADLGRSSSVFKNSSCHCVLPANPLVSTLPLIVPFLCFRTCKLFQAWKKIDWHDALLSTGSICRISPWRHLTALHSSLRLPLTRRGHWEYPFHDPRHYSFCQWPMSRPLTKTPGSAVPEPISSRNAANLCPPSRTFPICNDPSKKIEIPGITSLAKQRQCTHRVPLILLRDPFMLSLINTKRKNLFLLKYSFVVCCGKFKSWFSSFSTRKCTWNDVNDINI